MDRDRSQQTPSKYVVPTGSGYLGTYTVSTDRTVTISTAALGDRDWPTNTAHAISHEDGIALVPHPDTTEPLAKYTLCRRFTGTRIAVGQAVIDVLELTCGDDVRVYDLEITDGREGILLVDADDDPRIATDGGHDTTAEHALELTLTLNSSDYSRSLATDQRRHTVDELLDQRGVNQ